MTKRIFRSVLLGALTVLFAALLLVLAVLYGYFGERLKTELSVSAGYIAQGVARSGSDYFDGLDTGGSRVTWVAADGTVLYDSEEDAAKMENHAEREEIKAAHDSGSGSATRFSATRGCRMVYYAMRLSDDTILRVSTQQYTVSRLLNQTARPALVLLPLSVLLAFWLAGRLSKQIVAPINALDLSCPQEAECYDELAPLLEKLHAQNLVISSQMKELRRKQEEFSAITSHMSEGFVVLDSKANVLSYNAAALRLLGASAPQSETSILALNRSEAVRSAVETALGGRRDERVFEREGLYEQLLANPVYEEGRLTGAVLVLLDVTEKQQREALRREFTANVSHELKTPLTAIFGTAEIMENGLVKPGDVVHFAGNIRKETGHLIDLVGDIIRLSQLDEGQVSTQMVSVDLYEMAQSVVDRLADAATQKEVRLYLTGAAAGVTGVPQILEEIIYNLCDNAITYNRAGGQVTVDVTASEQGARLTVSDTGIGIPQADQQRVFERFYRVDKSHTGKGTGLGLSIVRHGAAYHGALLRLESKENEGTTITVQFPPD